MTFADLKTTQTRRRRNRAIANVLEAYLAKTSQDALAKEARRQPRMAAKYERRQKPNNIREEDIPGWK